ncbi:RNA polymerase-binding protein DksA [Rhizobacter sp. J219]|uniref:RNA polymerase-binding protein DksA n=1 Tax=Rhizobacter sp. J219 TaxID=2898430 RepID=UPI00215086E3|nr:RNA polymerase-binding protein DksA [Rhizobacter sp. J219]MCR5885263.1 RNA polymerase-binding protein DksA [Rhizobacter sp. J219]
MTKTPVKRPTPTKPAAKKPAPAAKKPATKAAAPASKTSAKPAASSKTKAAAKAPAKPLKPASKTPPPKPAAKPAAKVVAKPVAAPAAKPTPAKTAPAKPVAKTAAAPEPVKTVTVTKTAVPAPPAEPPKPAKTPQPKMSAAARASAAASTPAPVPPATSRFADRFAPPRPPARMVDPILADAVKTPHKSDPKLANAWKSKAGRDLTEAEVLAMPDSEYMNEKQLEFFRTKLQTLKDDLLSNAGETTEHLREDTTIVPDPADRATIEEEHALELRTRDRERKLLKKISQSLARIDAGDYGFCDETGEPIGLGRLIARPTATLSLEAQQRRELKQKMFGD